MINPYDARFLGVAGVSKYESIQAKRLAQYFEWPMVALAIWIPVQWYLTTLNALPAPFIVVLDWLVWGLFVVETILMSSIVISKKRYLTGNWINLLIIIFGCPLLWHSALLVGSLRGLRLLVLLGVLLKLSRSGQRILRKNRLGATLLVSSVVIVFAGVFISIVDPAFQSPWEGIWWAWVTVTTVGYGDFVPVSTVGRVFGGLLILLGVSLFALLTANFSAALIGQEVSATDDEIAAVEDEIAEVEKEENLILIKLAEIEDRMSRIENKLNELD